MWQTEWKQAKSVTAQTTLRFLRGSPGRKSDPEMWLKAVWDVESVEACYSFIYSFFVVVLSVLWLGILYLCAGWLHCQKLQVRPRPKRALYILAWMPKKRLRWILGMDIPSPFYPVLRTWKWCDSCLIGNAHCFGNSHFLSVPVASKSCVYICNLIFACVTCA